MINKDYYIEIQSLYVDYFNLISEFLVNVELQVANDKYCYTFYNLIQRLNVGIQSLDLLLDKFILDDKFKYPIAIQIRNCLSDCIVIIYLSKIKNRNEFIDKIARLNNPIIGILCEEIQQKIKLGKLDTEEYNSRYKYIVNIFPDNFTKGENPKFINSIKRIQPKEMVKSINEDWLNDCYKIYNYYSNFEHYNSISKDLISYYLSYNDNHFGYSLYYILQCTKQAVNNIGKYETILIGLDNLIGKFLKIKPK